MNERKAVCHHHDGARFPYSTLPVWGLVSYTVFCFHGVVFAIAFIGSRFLLWPVLFEAFEIFFLVHGAVVWLLESWLDLEIANQKGAAFKRFPKRRIFL